mmetsp:Transcript_41702/g.75433  ORF Transcript_41702/g.75433 Transcript_41702/m.75433 type:complete len:202 (-) Transcript_41702:336-941(-)
MIKRRPDSTGIPHHEGISVAQQPSDAVSSVPETRSPSENAGDVDVLTNQAKACLRTVSRGGVLDVKVIVFLVHKVSDLFEQHNSIRKLSRMLAKLDETGEKILVVCDVEVAGQNEIPRHPVALARHGVAAVDTVLAVRPIAYMSQVGLTTEGDVVLDPPRVHLFLALWTKRDARCLRSFAQEMTSILLDPSEEVADRVGGY